MRLDPEKAHSLSLFALRACPSWVFPSSSSPPQLGQTLWGHRFDSPVGLAAGYDKDAQVVRELYGLGFGFVEIGGVTLHAQLGNPRPRLFRLTEDNAVINRMGLNSEGVAKVVERLMKVTDQGLPGPLAVNLGLNKDSQDPSADYGSIAERLAPVADMLTINVSSPNTPGLRTLQDPAKLSEIVKAVRSAAIARGGGAPPAVLIKIAPDLSEQDIVDLANFAVAHDVDGMVVSNTTVARPDSLISEHKAETGGLSGAPLFEASTEVLRAMYKLTEGQVPLIGVGGISSGAQAYAKIRAGASLVQLYSALVYEGPSLVSRMTKDLTDLLKADGYTTIKDAVGADHRRDQIG